MDHLAPTSGIRALGDPAAPILDRPHEISLSLLLGQCQAATRAGWYLLENKADSLTFLQLQFGTDAAVILFEWNRRSQSQAESRSMKCRTSLKNQGSMIIPPVIERA